jgi:hypothetical protein
VAALPVEAASQDKGRPVTFGTGHQGLAGDCLGLLVTSLRVEGEDQPIAGGLCQEWPGPIMAASGSSSCTPRVGGA